MPVYRYTAAFPRHLHGLTHGVNAHHAPADGHDPAWGGTVTADTGDLITTTEAYPHNDLEEVPDEDTSQTSSTRKRATSEEPTHTETEQE